jgi:hypothetical protein
MLRELALAVSVLALVGCGGDEGDGGTASIASGPVTGKVGAMSWTLASAQTDSFFSDETEFWVDLFAEASTCGSTASGHSVILTVPNRVGTHPLGLNLTATFSLDNDDNDNLATTEGAIRVDAITDTTIRGGVTMTFDADNSISGEFEATICP